MHGKKGDNLENKTEKITNIDKNKRERNEESKVKYNDKYTYRQTQRSIEK